MTVMRNKKCGITGIKKGTRPEKILPKQPVTSTLLPHTPWKKEWPFPPGANPSREELLSRGLDVKQTYTDKPDSEWVCVRCGFWGRKTNWAVKIHAKCIAAKMPCLPEHLKQRDNQIV